MKTPDEWLKLIADANFAALDREQLEALHAELVQSATLRQAFEERLALEEVLAEALARPVINAGEIRLRSSRRGPSVPTMLVVAVALAVAAVIGWNKYFRDGVPSDDFPQVVERPGQAEIEDPPGDNPAIVLNDPPPDGIAPPQVPADGANGDAATNEPPWSEPTQLGAAAADWSELAWRPIAAPTMTGKALQAWFAPTDASAEFPPEKTSGPIRGAFRLRAPWPEDAALRLEATYDEPFQMHIAAETTSVTLEFHPEMAPHTGWVAYVSQDVVADSPTASSQSSRQLAASDYGKFWRWKQAETATITLRRDRQRLALSVGDAVLLEVPLAFEPQQVLLDGAIELRRIELSPFADDATKGSLPQFATVALSDWQTSRSSALTVNEQGTQAVLKDSQPTTAWAAFRPHGWTPWFVEVDAAGAGVSVYLGDVAGAPLHEFRILRDPVSGGRWLGQVEPGSDQVEQIPDMGDFPVPWAGEKFFLRPRLAGRFVWCDVSVDGRNWAPTAAPQEMFDAYQVRTIGMASLGGEAQISLRLHQAEPTGGELAQAAFAVAISSDVASYDAWLAAVDRARPPRADADAWRRVCAEQLASSDFQPTLNHQLLARLFEDEFALPRKLRSQQEVAQRLDRLDAWMFHVGPWQPLASPVEWKKIRAAYRHLAEQWVQLGEPTPLSTIGRRLLASPAWFDAREDFWLDDLAVWQLTALVEAQDWTAIARTNLLLRYCDDALVQKNVAWAANVRRERDPTAAAEDVQPIALEWHHPLKVRIGREDFDLLSNLRGLVEGGQFDDACRLIAGSPLFEGHGVAASPDDPQLWVSLPLAVDRLFDEHPQLGETMRTSYSSLAEARVRKALADNDMTAMLAVSRRFPTTAAAAQADVWLGNHRLALGDLRSALDHYRRAESQKVKDETTEIDSRVRLAAAMLGGDAGAPVAQAVDFGGVSISPPEFEALVTELRQRHRLANRTIAERSAFSPGPLDIAAFGRAVESTAAGEMEPPLDYRDAEVSAATRELAIVEHGGAMFVSNRYGVAAYDSGGQRRWEATLGERAGRENAWPLVRMQPVLSERRLLTRLITQKGPHLFAIDAASGQLLWQARVEAEGQVVCDPEIVGDEALVLVAAGRGREQQISLARFDLVSGDRLASTPIFGLATGWLQYGQARLAARDDAIYLVLGGAIARVQFDGRVDWIRQQTWRAPALVPHWYRQLAPTIYFHDSAIIVAQPGVDYVEALDQATGEHVWRYDDPTLLGIVGATKDGIVGRSLQGFFVLDPEHGRCRQHLTTEVAGDGHYLDDWSTLFFFRRDSTPPYNLQAWWWDAHEGKLLGGDSLALGANQGFGDIVIAPLALARSRMIGGLAPFGSSQPAALIGMFRQTGSPGLRPPPESNAWESGVRGQGSGT